MNRRGFLSRFVMGVAGIALAPELPKVIVFEPSKWQTYQAADAIGLQRITLEVFRVVDSLVSTPYLILRGHQLGHDDNGVTINHQIRVDPLWWSASGSEVKRSDIQGCGEALAARIKRDGMTHFAVLEHRLPGAESAVVTAHGLSVRGVMQYDIQRDEFRTRFDILGRVA